MEKFSDRIGITSRPVLGLNEAPYNLRVSMWNVIQPLLFRVPAGQSKYAWMANIERLYDFLHLPANQVGYIENNEIGRFEGWLFSAQVPWYEALNFIDFAAQSMWQGKITQSVCNALDRVFEREGSPYRYIGGVLTPIANPVELEELL
jgi:hypothetical protein